jgi:hypothetical protein
MMRWARTGKWMCVSARRRPESSNLTHHALWTILATETLVIVSLSADRVRNQGKPSRARNRSPFVDGNGRTGRALIHFVLRKRGLATRVLPPISLVLATWAKDYVEGLQGTRYRGPALSAGTQRENNVWVARFAAACVRAAADAADFEKRSRLLQGGGGRRLGQ